jgi:hypothetical protein
VTRSCVSDFERCLIAAWESSVSKQCLVGLQFTKFNFDGFTAGQTGSDDEIFEDICDFFKET